MKKSLGFDTSNYTTSIALSSEEGYVQSRKILDLEKGERGLRQSNALFLHTKNLNVVLDNLKIDKEEIICTCASDKPRDEIGSYMPCFLAGENVGKMISHILSVPFYSFSHQAGHIMAAIQSSRCKNLVNEEFLAYHLSGGTTELIHCVPDKNKGFKTNIIGGTKDLSFGQLIDRCGVRLDYLFPCGQRMENDCHFDKLEKIKTKTKSSFFNCSGFENKYNEMIINKESKENIIKYVFSVCASIIVDSVRYAQTENNYSNLPIIFVGGVIRNKYIRSFIEDNIDCAKFGDVELSSDNAVGISYLGLYKERGMLG